MRQQQTSPKSDTIPDNKPTADQVIKLIVIIVTIALFGCAATTKSTEDNAAISAEATLSTTATAKQQQAMQKEVAAYSSFDGECAELLQNTYDKHGYHEDRTRTGTNDSITLYRWYSAGYSLRLTTSSINNNCEWFESIGSQLEK